MDIKAFCDKEREISCDMNRVLYLVLIFLNATTANAIQWESTELVDPLTKDKVPAKEIVSVGDYIYGWPLTYDLVFWPFIEDNWICLNHKNGYAAFNNDFEKISRKKKKVLIKWLAENYSQSQTPKSHQQKIAWLERVYQQRKMDDDFWCHFYRVAAYVFQEDPNKNLEYVRKAIPLLEAQLAKAKEASEEKIQYLFLLGEYNRRIGDSERAKEYFSRVKTATYKDEDGKKSVGHPYFVTLVEECENIPTGTLPPSDTDE